MRRGVTVQVQVTGVIKKWVCVWAGSVFASDRGGGGGKNFAHEQSCRRQSPFLHPLPQQHHYPIFNYTNTNNTPYMRLWKQISLHEHVQAWSLVLIFLLPLASTNWGPGSANRQRVRENNIKPTHKPIGLRTATGQQYNTNIILILKVSVYDYTVNTMLKVCKPSILAQ